MGNRFDITGFENDQAKVLELWDKLGEVLEQYKCGAPDDDKDDFLEKFLPHAQMYSRKLETLQAQSDNVSFTSQFGLVLGATLDSLIGIYKNAFDTYVKGITLGTELWDSGRIDDGVQVTGTYFQSADALMQEGKRTYAMACGLVEENLA